MSGLEVRLKARARELGFTLSGVAPAADADGFARYRDWLARGFAGEMTYLHTQGEARRHPRSILETVRSVVMLGMEYGAAPASRGRQPPVEATPKTTTRDESRCEEAWGEFPPGADAPGSPAAPLAAGRVARYAQGPDYHRFVWDRINELAAWLEGEVPGCRTEAVADTAPLLERDFARRAGLGWVGKNTMLINPARGSFFFLAAVLTDLDLAADEPFAASHCGTCTACLDACPTKAFPEPFVLDATRCISYLTIELRGPIPVELREPVGDWLYGCDVCQDVCPWNRKESPGPVAFPRDPEMQWLAPVELLTLDADAFREQFKKTSLWRNRRAGLLRNAAIVLGNVGDERSLPALERAKTDEEEAVREAAAWAAERIRQRTSSVNRG
ncbi:MAG TPA: tRNA epoxyqueuosine(34) reductase QueG [Gemmata sp.]|nr:tRNA epoxyqueuosine(34) reductase QueG [Gemmata sp.]